MTKKERNKLNRYYQKKYGITWNDRQKIYKAQNGCCGICQKHETHFTRRLAIDHNHRTGLVRGLLCFRCNKILLGRHTLDTARSIYLYLVKHEGEK